MVDEGRERMLVIEDVPREAQGLFECKTNSDETQMKLRVAPVNEFLKPLEDQTCAEKEQVTFECQMGDDEADAEWKIAGDVVQEDDRIQIKKLDKGVHRLIILRARITDTGDVSCTCVGQNETTAQLLVNKAEVVVEAEDQDANDGKVKTKAKGKKRIHCFVLLKFSLTVSISQYHNISRGQTPRQSVPVIPPITCFAPSSFPPRAWWTAHCQDQRQEGGRGAPG